MSNKLTEGKTRTCFGKDDCGDKPNCPPPPMRPPNEGSSGTRPKTVEAITIKVNADTKDIEAALVRLSEFADELREKFDGLIRDVDLAFKGVREFSKSVKSDE